MTEAAAVTIKRFDGNSSATNFPFTFNFLADDELLVTHMSSADVITFPVLNTDYTVNGAGGTSGSIDFPKAGSAYGTLDSGPPAERLTVERTTLKNRTVTMDGSYQFVTLNDDNDKRTRIEQELYDMISRAALQTVSNDGTVPTLESVLAGTATLDITSLDALATLLDAHVLHVNDGDDKKVTAAVIATYILLAPVLGGTLNANSNDIDNAKTITFGAEVANTGATPTIDWGAGQKQKLTLTATATPTDPFTVPDGPCNLLLKVIQAGTGSYTITWPAAVKWPTAGTAPTLSTAVGAVDIISFYYDGTSYHGQAALDFQ